MPPVNVGDEVLAANEVSWALVDCFLGWHGQVRASVFERHHNVTDSRESSQEFGSGPRCEQGVGRVGQQNDDGGRQSSKALSVFG